MTAEKVIERLQFDPSDDFKRLYNAFRQSPSFLVPTRIEACFSAARGKPEYFRNHPPVLALSIGGSTTSAMLAEMKDGIPLVHHVTDGKNPAAPIPLEDYLDLKLLAEPPFRTYLATAAKPVIAISVAVMIKHGVPYHPSKLAMIEGLVAKNPDTQAQTHHLGNNLAVWLAKRGLQPAEVVYEGDAPVAHLGGVGLSNMTADDRSLLMVCGNGMACADTTRFIVCGMVNCLCDDDPELFQPLETENGQYQYLAAGKGIYKILRRAAELAGIDASAYFRNNHDSVHVYHLWAGKSTPALLRMKAELGTNFQTLETLAKAIVPRGIRVFANSILCSILLNGPAPGNRPYRLFLEGSIGTDPDVVPALKKQIQELLNHPALFAELGIAPPPMPEIAHDLNQPGAAENLPEGALKKVDMSLIGALFLGTTFDIPENVH
jgi:hypothetical protein